MQRTGAEVRFVFQHELHVRNLIATWYALLNKNDSTAVFLALEICKNLQRDKNYALLEMFLRALPENEIYSKNEEIVRAKIHVANENKNFELVYELIKNNKFQNGEDLVEIWDNAHYNQEFERTQKPLTALSRFRIRERYLPPQTICPSRERRKASLGHPSRYVLQQWLDEHSDNPYPSKETKEYLSKKADITIEQVKTWFANARRRLARQQGNETRRLSWQRYQRKVGDKECEKVMDTVLSPSLEKCEKDGEIIEPKICGQKGDIIPVHHEDSMTDMTVNMSDNSQVKSRLPPISSFLSPCSSEEIHTRLACPLSNSSNTPQIMKSLPDVLPLELIQPQVVVNPNLYGPKLLTHFYDYSNFPVHSPCSVDYSPCSMDYIPCSTIYSPCFGQPNSSFNYKDVYFTMSEATYPSNGICSLIPCGFPGQLIRFDAASALLDLSLLPRMPGN